MDAIDALKTRRSIRQYTDKPVPKDVIEDLIDCGRLATSARNVQPWEFIVVTDAGLRAEIASHVPNGPFIAEAPVCIVVVCLDGMYYLEDGCNASQNIVVAAHAHGLGSCWVAGDKKPYSETVRSLVGAPDTHKLVSMIAIGYSNSAPNPSKRSLKDVLHWERF